MLETRSRRARRTQGGDDPMDIGALGKGKGK